jgi:hypothetical protein
VSRAPGAAFSTELESRLVPYREAYNATLNGWLHDRSFGVTYPALLLVPR